MVAHPLRERSGRYAAQPNQNKLRGNFFAAGFVWDIFAAGCVHRNIHLKRTPAIREDGRASTEKAGDADIRARWDRHHRRRRGTGTGGARIRIVRPRAVRRIRGEARRIRRDAGDGRYRIARAVGRKAAASWRDHSRGVRFQHRHGRGGSPAARRRVARARDTEAKAALRL